jgi:pseudouridine synthase
MRIQKYLSQQGILSRRKAELYLQKGWIKVNGKVVTTPGTKVEPGLDVVTLDEKIDKIRSSYQYIAFHKPVGIITNCPQAGETEIKNLLPKKYKGLYAIGRLDKDSEGLILLTDDGVFSKKCLQGDLPHSREYNVWINDKVTDYIVKNLEGGMLLFGRKTLPIKVKMIEKKLLNLTMIEGKNRQIRRMFQELGRKVVRLQRVRFGPVELGDLGEGQCRILSAEDMSKLGAV